MIFELLTQLLIVTTGILLPAYNSYKSLRQKASTNRLIWLRYWVVFGFYYAISTITDILFSWFPLYSFSKIVFLLWLSSSKASGAQIVFNFAVLPLLKNREPAIDKRIEDFKKQSVDYFWTIVASTGINWSLILAAALKSGVGMLAVDDHENVINNVKIEAPDNHADAVDGVFSDEEAMVTDEETQRIQTTPQSHKRGGKAKGRVTKIKGRRVVVDGDE